MKKLTFIIVFITVASNLTSCTVDEAMPTKKPTPMASYAKDSDITPPPPPPPIKY